MENEGAYVELPKYRCHKEVHALKIKTVEPVLPETGTVTLTFEDPRYATRMVDVDNRPKPEPGWYWVLYPGGYHSFSPAKEFEDGYALIPNRPFRVGDRVNFAPASGNPREDRPMTITDVETHNGMEFYRLNKCLGGLFLAYSLVHA